MRFFNTVFTLWRVLQVPLRAVLPFLQGGLRSAGEQRRNSTVVRSLRRAENLQVREELIRCRQRCVAPAGTRFVLKRALPLLNSAPAIRHEPGFTCAASSSGMQHHRRITVLQCVALAMMQRLSSFSGAGRC